MALLGTSLVLADISIWAHRRHASVKAWFEEAVDEGELAVCDLVVLELLAASATLSYARNQRSLDAFPQVAMSGDDWLRARQLQHLLVSRGHGYVGAVSIRHLLMAATAGRAGLPLIHCHPDFDIIRPLTGQVMRWYTPAGPVQQPHQM